VVQRPESRFLTLAAVGYASGVVVREGPTSGDATACADLDRRSIRDFAGRRNQPPVLIARLVRCGRETSEAGRRSMLSDPAC